MIATPSGRNPVAPALGLAFLAGLAGGCAHWQAAPAARTGSPAPASAPATLPAQPSEDLAEPPASGVRPEDSGTQSLFRVQYQGLQGSGALRLVLKIASPERYRIETKDRFGRGLWRIEGGPGEHLLVDDRAKLFCTSEDGIRIPEIALEALPLGDLPAILLDRLPGDLEPVVSEAVAAGEPAEPSEPAEVSESGAGEYRDRHGRRWTVTMSGDEPSAWTFWEDGEPRIWWRREAPGEAVLSHRAGTQLRWKRVALEPMTAEFEAVTLEAGYRRISCEDWPGTAGGGSDP